MDYPKSSPAIEVFAVGADVAECPWWDRETRSLYWIDIRRPAFHRAAASGQPLGNWTLPDPVGAFALLQDGTAALVALASGLAVLQLADGSLTRVRDPEPERPGNRLNEGKVSPCGRFFVFGSMDDRPDKEPTGSLYCLAADGQLAVLKRGLIVANGVAWSPDGSDLYFSDSRAARIWRAPWHGDGTIGEPVTFATLSEEAGRPDGAAMDRDGCYWSAGVSAGRLNRFDPAGRLIETVGLPVQAPTMPAFADDGTVFVTSHRRIAAPAPMDGAVLRLRLPVEGIPIPRFAASAGDLV